MNQHPCHDRDAQTAQVQDTFAEGSKLASSFDAAMRNN
jgi:hypothetical protein